MNTEPTCYCKDKDPKSTEVCLVCRPIREEDIDYARKRLVAGAYYYGFAETGVQEIDDVLGAVSAAGKMRHHTSGWQDSDEDLSCQDLIQGIANLSAEKLSCKSIVPDAVFRAILDCFMVADATPIRERANLDAWLDEQSLARGFANWVVAYHEFQKKDQA